MRKCEFEEDAYQQQVDQAIGRLTNISTTPGRVLENILGYDAAFYLDPAIHGELLSDIAYVRSRRLHHFSHGVFVNDQTWDGLINRNILSIPPFKLNLFLQYKSPSELHGWNAGEMNYWKRSYFRYGISIHQRDILCKIEDLAGSTALVCYASPAFVESARLWDCMKCGNILDFSHFIRAGYLRNHGRYTYANARGHGRGYSEPERIDPDNFEQMLENALINGEASTLEQLISSAAKHIMIATDEAGTPIEPLISSLASESELSRNLEVIRAFRIFYGTHLYFVG